MVKLTGPMNSLAAGGTLANTITFSTNKGRAYARTRVLTPNPKTPPQVSQRMLWQFASRAWNGVPSADKESWAAIAARTDTSPYNAYMGSAALNWNNFLPPSRSAPPGRSLDASDRVMNSITWDEHRVKIRTVATVANDQWGLLIHVGPTPDYTPTKDTVIIFELDQDLDVHYTYWTYPERIAMRFKTQPFSSDGKLSTFIGSWTLNP